MKRFLYSLWETFEVVIVAVAAVLIIRTYLVQPFLVSGASMEPNFSSGDYLLVDEVTFRFRNPERGEVIIFRYPANPKVFYIKRIIGLPGERVVLDGNLITVFNSEHPEGLMIAEEYLRSGQNDFKKKESTLGSDEFFVLGDNRSYSFDSRSWGPLKEDNIIGVARLRLWPINKVAAVEKPSY